MGRKLPILLGIAVVLVIAVLAAIPIKQRCGNPNYTCATAPDEQGNIHYFYAVVPLGVVAIENLTDWDFSSIRYSSGEELVKAR